MRTTLLASTCLVSLMAIPAHAETTISTATTAAVQTATVNAGGADDIKIASAGSIKPASGTAVTINSNHKLVNDGTIQFTNVDGARGVVAEAGVTSNITNSATGKIILDESYAPTDADNDGDLDGPFATGTDRVGILTNGAFTGNITNSGSIQIEGNNSAGIRLGGPLTGKFVNDGTIAVLGDNATGVALSDVTGNVRLAGTIAATGSGARAAVLSGDITGALEVQGSLTSTGYRYTTAPADPSKLDGDDLLDGGAALTVEGNVTGGIILAVPPKESNANSTDDDADGIEDSKEGSAAVRSFGSAPAMLVGSASNDIAIGAVAGTGTGMGIVIDGIVAGNGLYAGKSATGLQIGGLGGNVTVAGGLGISGTVGALSRDVAATAIQIGAGADVPEIRNSGKVEAISNGTAATAVATAIHIQSGSDVTTIKNSGAITAKTGGDAGTARAIYDQSGTVSLVENSGTISATGALATSNRNVAIDLSANNGGTTIRQTAVATGIAAPSIVGDILLGGGNDILDIADGTVKGTSNFGAGNNSLALSGDAAYEGAVIFGSGDDIFSLAGTARFIGSADFGGSGADTLTIGGTSVFSGTLANSAHVAASVSGGTFDVKGNASLASLAVTGGGALGVMLGGPSDTNITISGDASFAADSRLILQLSSIEEGEGEHVVLTAGSITGGTNLAANSDLLPFLYKGTLTHSATAITVDVTRKTAVELGLNRSETAAFNAIINAAAEDAAVEGTFLAIRDGENFRNSVGQMMPEHEGGVFETVTSGSRALSRWLLDPNAPFKDEGKWGWFINQAVWGTSKSIGDTAGYDVTGWGISIGGEIKTGVGNFGGSVAYLGGKDGNRANANEVTSHQWEGALHWRLASQGFQAHARVSGAPVSLTGTRMFTALSGVGTSDKNMIGKWDAQLYSASGGLSYDAKAGGFTISPAVAVDYYKLSEDGYQESGGGDALDLTVAGRDSDELAVSGTVAVGMQFGGEDAYSGFTRFELEGGRRQIVSGNLGATTASFTDGTPFTLTPDDRTSGWIGRVRALVGNTAFQFGGEASAEEQQGRTAWAFRASLRLGL